MTTAEAASPQWAYKDRCGLQVAPTDALAVLAEV
jgi:hypothetical protein